MVDANLNVLDSSLEGYTKLKIGREYKYIILKIEEQKNIAIEKASDPSTPIDRLQHDLPPNEPRFVVLDYDWTNSDGLVLPKIIFIYWLPDNSGRQNKMLYASSKESLKRKFDGIYKEFVASEPSDLTEAAIAQSIRY